MINKIKRMNGSFEGVIRARFNPNFVTGFFDAFIKKGCRAGIKYFSSKRPSGCSNSLSLVVWGTNLTSSVGLGRFTKQESNMIKLAPYQKGVIIGLLLSDGGLNFASKTNKNARLTFKQSLARGSYVLFVFNLLSHYCSSVPHLSTSVRAGKSSYALGILTRSLPCFSELYDIFYVNGVKVIPNNIYDLLTQLALAHAIMGDGTVKNQGLILCTDSYTLQDTVRLMNGLILRYELKCTLHKASNGKGYRIYISRKSVGKVVEIVKPYLIPSMYYKVGII